VVVALAEYTINIRARWWTNSTRRSVIDINDRVLTTILAKLSNNGIELPFPTYQILPSERPEMQNGEPGEARPGSGNGRATQPPHAPRRS
jgi:small-conductance mechanosensitive channel